MESEDKRHIRRKYGRVSIPRLATIMLLALSGCRSQADGGAADASPRVVAPEAAASSSSTGADAALAFAFPPPRACSICGEWERGSEPYKGMRIEIREGSSKGVVTRSATVDPGAKNKAQLECQRSLWKPGDVLLTLDGAKGTIIVRDWGLVGGVCRHQDTKASVVLIGEDEDNVIFSVTRGKTMVNQDWSRVR